MPRRLEPSDVGKTPLRVAVLASGRGSNLRSLLSFIAAGRVDAQVVLVASDQATCGALEIAHAAGVPVHALPPAPDESRASYDDRLASVLATARPDLVVLAGYLRIVGPALCARFENRILNIHPSLLPSYKGLQAVKKAHRAGARIAGCTTHLVTPELDGGPILLQAALAIRLDETFEHLQRRILALEHLLLPRTVQLFAEGRVHVEGAVVTIAPGSSWLPPAEGVDLVAGALYGEGF